MGMIGSPNTNTGYKHQKQLRTLLDYYVSPDPMGPDGQFMVFLDTNVIHVC